MDNEQAADMIVSCIGMNIACLESWSMMTRMESKPAEEGSFLMKFMEIEFPRSVQYWELLKISVGLVTLRFGLHASDTRFAKVLDMSVELWPGVFPVNEFEGLVLTKVSG
jgi:hypothetical protein